MACLEPRREEKEGDLEGNTDQTPFVGPASFAGARGGFVVCGTRGLRGGGACRLFRQPTSEGSLDEARRGPPVILRGGGELGVEDPQWVGLGDQRQLWGVRILEAGRGARGRQAARQVRQARASPLRRGERLPEGQGQSIRGQDVRRSKASTQVHPQARKARRRDREV